MTQTHQEEAGRWQVRLDEARRAQVVAVATTAQVRVTATAVEGQLNAAQINLDATQVRANVLEERYTQAALQIVNLKQQVVEAAARRRAQEAEEYRRYHEQGQRGGKCVLL